MPPPRAKLGNERNIVKGLLCERSVVAAAGSGHESWYRFCLHFVSPPLSLPHRTQLVQDLAFCHYTQQASTITAQHTTWYLKEWYVLRLARNSWLFYQNSQEKCYLRLQVFHLQRFSAPETLQPKGRRLHWTFYQIIIIGSSNLRAYGSVNSIERTDLEV